MGSCGLTNSEAEPVVAVAKGIMDAQGASNPNANPLCGKTITISHGGQKAEAKIVDTCPGCAGEGLDLSPSLFQRFASLDAGRVVGVEWWEN